MEEIFMISLRITKNAMFSIYPYPKLFLLAFIYYL